MVNLRSGKNCDTKPILVPQTQRVRTRKNPKQCFVKMVNLRSGKNCDVKPIVVPQAQRGRKRKNPKQCFESDSEDELPNVLERKPKIFMEKCDIVLERKPKSFMEKCDIVLERKPKIFTKKCDMCASSFRSQVHLKEHISKHPEPDLFIRPDGLPITFVMPTTSCEEKNSMKCSCKKGSCKERREVKFLVEEGGGALLETPEGDNWVWLLTSKDNFLGHSEAISASYVKDCVEQRRILPDLAKYRVGSLAPRFRENPLEVMLGFRGWTESTPIADVKPKTRDIYDMGIIGEESDLEVFESFLRETESLELSEGKTESLTDLIRNFEIEADVLEDVQEWARTELAKTEMSEYLPKVQNTTVEQNQGRMRPVTPDQGFESGGDDEDLEDCPNKRKETTQNNCHQDETTKAVSEPRKIFLMAPCQHCRKSFNCDEYLMNHVKKVHRETLPSLPCTFCSKTFISEEILKRHMNEKCGKRPKSYSCKLCDETFGSNYRLMKHKIVHMDQKQFPCQYCEKNCKTNDLRRFHEVYHVRRHHQAHKGGAFPCEECRESFAKAKYLKTVFEKNMISTVVLS